MAAFKSGDDKEDKDKDKEKEKKEREKEKERGAKDDWEALKIVLDEHPSLKQRVLHKLRAMIRKDDSKDNNISKKAQHAYLREMRKKSKEQK